MNVIVLQENLLKALTRTGRIVSTKSQLPIAQHVLITASEGRLTLATTNLETTMVTRVGAKVTQEGGVCVPSKLFSELVASFPQDQVELRAEEGVLRVSCGGFNASLPGMAPGEFPPLPELKDKEGVSLDKATLIDALSSVIFSAATDEGRPLLTGIRFVGKEGPDASAGGAETLVAATDGYRLSVKHLVLAGGEKLNLVVPARALSEVVKVGAEDKELSSVSLNQSSDSQLAFVLGDTEVYTRVIDGEYPNFEKIIPASHSTQMVVDKEVLLRAVKSAAIFARDNANIIRFHVDGNTLTVSANTPQVGENKVDVEVNTDGEGGDMAFNSRFLLEFLGNTQGDQLVFEMTGSLNPGVFKRPNDDSYLHIIMPVRVAA